ncbi:unnamed protein product [Pleuronectes platessa]|uniref:Uncharacterized protein n=1 Tax=Pleuronectes platessa TaxID=8262 RepID=A0A9N7YW00_PLEPL|nr:unnamed protein product [Pleuronectes platessa]
MSRRSRVQTWIRSRVQMWIRSRVQTEESGSDVDQESGSDVDQESGSDVDQDNVFVWTRTCSSDGDWTSRHLSPLLSSIPWVFIFLGLDPLSFKQRMKGTGSRQRLLQDLDIKRPQSPERRTHAPEWTDESGGDTWNQP